MSRSENKTFLLSGNDPPLYMDRQTCIKNMEFQHNELAGDAPMDVLVVYHYVAHYREPVFIELMENGACRYRLSCGDKLNEPSMKVVDAESPIYHDSVKLKNVWFGKHFLWQSGINRILFHPAKVIILLGNMYFISSWMILLLAKLTGKKVLLWTHGVKRDSDGARERIRDCFYRLSDGLLLYGTRARRLLGKRGLPIDRMYIVYNSLDHARMKQIDQSLTPEDIAAVRQEFAIPEDATVLISSSRLSVNKKLTLLLQAVREMTAQGSHVYCLIVGDGEERSRLETYIDTQGLSNVRLLGACYDEARLCQLFRASDICVVPGDIGLSAIHAMTYGVPVITHNDLNSHGPEYEAVIEGRTGFLFRRDSVSDLVARINELRQLLQTRPIDVSGECRALIEKHYTPAAQRHAIDRAVQATVGTG